MYYKITNTDSEVYRQMSLLLAEEKGIEENNKKALADKIPYKWDKYIGYAGQQAFSRTTEYYGFLFLEPEKVDTKVWKQDKDGMFYPNKRTKAGREMAEFLRNGIKRSWYREPLKILGCDYDLLRFKLPFVEQCNDVIVLFLDNKHILISEYVVEITSKEFNSIRDEYWKTKGEILTE